MKKELGHEAIYDARQLGTPRMLILGLQHMFAMFGATVLVPILVQGYGLPLSIQTTLLFAGLGTLLFHVCTKFKVPAFLGSSFAYLGGFSTVATMPAYEGLDPETKLAARYGAGRRAFAFSGFPGKASSYCCPPFTASSTMLGVRSSGSTCTVPSGL